MFTFKERGKPIVQITMLLSDLVKMYVYLIKAFLKERVLEKVVVITLLYVKKVELKDRTVVQIFLKFALAICSIRAKTFTSSMKLSAGKEFNGFTKNPIAIWSRME